MSLADLWLAYALASGAIYAALCVIFYILFTQPSEPVLRDDHEHTVQWCEYVPDTSRATTAYYVQETRHGSR
ncbi:MAG TPA: hypothetical protein VGU45_01495 [Microvirga sp.]|jgi:hypothetical protein|nr:hypothetical protein [Microvirga sp.]